jgi:hypothetical protein
MQNRTHRVLGSLIAVALTTSLATADVVYYNEGFGPFESKIVRSTTDGAVREVLIDGVFAEAMALDTLRGKLYWIGESLIRRSNLDGSDVEVVVSDVVGSGRDIQIDIAAGKLYWLDTANIRRANLDGTEVEVIVDTPSLTNGIALHVPSGKIYWTENSIDDPDQIRRASLDGSDVETILTREDWHSLWDIEIASESPGSRMFWIQFASNPGPAIDMASANLDGSDYQVLDFGTDSESDIAMTSTKVYWMINSCGDQCFLGRVSRGNPDGSGEMELFQTQPLLSIAIDETSSSVPATSAWSIALLALIVVVTSGLWVARLRP